MKKILAGAAVVGLVGFAGVQIVSASDSYGYCGQGFTDSSAISSKVLDEFRSENSAIRKDIVVKRSELRALYNQDNPNEKRVAQLTGELFDLQNEIEQKATAKGLGSLSSYGHGPEMMDGNSSRYGHGPEMMDGYSSRYGHGPEMMYSNNSRFEHGPAMMYNNGPRNYRGGSGMNNNATRYNRGSEMMYNDGTRNKRDQTKRYGHGPTEGRSMMNW